MPRSGLPESLESLCAKSVALNLGKVKWGQSFVEDEDDSSVSSNPLNVLPSSVLVSVIAAVKEVGITKYQEQHLVLLITKKLEELDLWSCHEVALRFLSTAAHIHSPLKVLKLHFLEIPYHKLLEFLPAFPNLLVLEVHSKIVDDSFTSLVVSSCPKLRSLNLMNCVGVTDIGMQRFCTTSNKSSSGGGLCGSLIQLDIRNTKVTQQGARLALEHLTKLRHFQWDSVGQLLVQMYRDGHRRPLALTSLRLYGKPNGPDCCENSFATAIKLCPLLVDVKFQDDYDMDIKDDVDIEDYQPSYQPSSYDLKALLELSNLQRLVLEDAGRISFDEDLLPVLEKFGRKSLDHLDVSRIREVNLGAIVENCPNLLRLYLRGVRQFIRSRRPLEPSPRYLPSLQRLKLEAGDGKRGLRVPFSCQPSASDLSLLLVSAPELVKLRLELLDNLNDRIFKQVIAQHGFPKLEDLHVSSCPNVTRNVVDLLLELDNPLYSIMFERYTTYESCIVTEMPFLLMKQFNFMDPTWDERIKRKKLNLSIYYCECNI